MREAVVLSEQGHRLHVYDQGRAPGGSELAVFWLHGTPNIGIPPAPLYAEAARLGLRWIGYDRPGYGSSTARPGRTVASAAADVACIADRLGIERFAVMGHSGGGPHALACAALLPGRVLAAASIAGLAPYGAEGLDWFGGMHAAGAAGLRAALEGRAAKLAYETAGPGFDPAMFTEADRATLAGPWSWFDTVVEPAMAQGPGGLVDDDLAYVAPWGFGFTGVLPPLLLLHGDEDRIVPASHGRWLARHLPSAELWSQPRDGHISVLARAADALGWLALRAA